VPETAAPLMELLRSVVLVGRRVSAPYHYGAVFERPR
jgi:hypothetical protein